MAKKLSGKLSSLNSPNGVMSIWLWLERCLIYREMMQRERKKREEESAQLHFLSALGIVA